MNAREMYHAVMQTACAAMCRRHASVRVSLPQVGAQDLVLHAPVHTADAVICKCHASIRVMTSVTRECAIPRVLGIRTRVLRTRGESRDGRAPFNREMNATDGCA